MHVRALILAAAMMTLTLQLPLGQALPPPNPLPCTNVDVSNPHFYSAVVGTGINTINLAGTRAYSTNGVPTGCDLIGSDGDDEQGIGGAKMPITGATCPYSQGSSTVGHHGDDIYATNLLNIDITWSSGIDGQDPAATLAGQTCTGNGIISTNAATDPADCMDTGGANINLFGSVHDDTDPLGVGTNDPASGFTCFDAVDGNEYTIVNSGPFVGTNPGSNGPAVIIAVNGALCVDLGYTGGNSDDLGCALGVNLGYAPPTPNGIVGYSAPVQGSIASGVEFG